MKPSSSIAIAAACALTMVACPAFAGTHFSLNSGGQTAAASASTNLQPVKLGQPPAPATLSPPGQTATFHHRRHNWQAYTSGLAAPVLVQTYVPVAAAPPVDDTFVEAPVAPQRVACTHPRIIEIAPQRPVARPAPVVVYGLRPPCEARIN